MKRLILSTLFILIFALPYVFSKDDSVKIIVLYDNYQFTENTIADWGFSCLVISGNDTVLFDTGARRDVLFHNLEALDLDLSTVQTLVISHHHGDHVGNLFTVAEANTDILMYLPSSMDGKCRLMVENYGVRTEVDQSVRQIAHNIFLSGEMGFQIREQGLVIVTSKGLVLISGCSHPGIDRMVRKVSSKFDAPVYMVVGGLHLEEHSDEEIDEVIQILRDYGVEKVAPGHCTGQKAMDEFRKVFKHNFIRSGTGKVIEL